jgi:hypothetical protein
MGGGAMKEPEWKRRAKEQMVTVVTAEDFARRRQEAATKAKSDVRILRATSELEGYTRDNIARLHWWYNMYGYNRKQREIYSKYK